MIVVLPEADGVAIAAAVREKLGLDDKLTSQDVLDYLSALLLRVHGNADPSTLHTFNIPVPSGESAVGAAWTPVVLNPTVTMTVESVVVNVSE